MSASVQPRVSIIVVPREKFSCAVQALDSIIEHTEEPHELIYVDARSPSATRDALAARCRARGYVHLRVECFLPTNKARNLGLTRARGEYVVFIENDVVVSSGWLGPLIRCAEATHATVVSPLICQGLPVHTYIHCAGGKCAIVESTSEDGRTERKLHERIARQSQRLEKALPNLARSQTQLAEFHCMMVRRDYFDQHGLLDERILNTREHVDFCIDVARNGGSIWFEPRSLVTYLHGVPIEPHDAGFFMIRWSDRWIRTTMERLWEKHELTPDRQAMDQRIRMARSRRRASIIRPTIQHLSRGMGGKIVANALERLSLPIERMAARAIHAWNDFRTPTDLY